MVGIPLPKKPPAILGVPITRNLPFSYLETKRSHAFHLEPCKTSQILDWDGESEKTTEFQMIMPHYGMSEVVDSLIGIQHFTNTLTRLVRLALSIPA